MGKLMIGKRPVIITGALYTLAILTIVLSAWIVNLHRFDLSITMEIYVALRPWTMIFHLVIATLMVGFMHRYLKFLNIPPYRKVIYGLIFGCFFGNALFPCNNEWSLFATDMHNFFGYSMMLAAAVSFVIIFMKGETRRKRACGVIAMCYSIFYIFAYTVVRWEAFAKNVFIWEALFFYFALIVIYYDDSLPKEEPNA